MISHGGWTPTNEHDHCAGGHPGGYYLDEDGRPTCNRCGRLIDLSLCGCGTPGHEHLSRSYCPMRIHDDRRALSRTPEIIERDCIVVARIEICLAERGLSADTITEHLGTSPARVRAMLDGERALVASEVAQIADMLDVRATWLVYGIGQATGERHLDVTACSAPDES